MSGSSVLVALNALLLKRTRLVDARTQAVDAAVVAPHGEVAPQQG